MLATPLTLISLLLTVAHGWRQYALAENADKIRETGLELYKRLGTMHSHFTRLGDAIGRTVAAYNDTVGSLERNILTQARKFRDLRPTGEEMLGENREVENQPRALDDARWGLLEPAERN